MRLPDNIDRILDKNSPAYITLVGYREVCKRFFQLGAFPLIQSQDVKRELRKGLDEQNVNMTKYPYAYFSLSSVGITKDQQPIKGAARNSLGFTLDELTNSMVKKAFVFPASISVDMHYVTDDVIDALNFCTRTLIIAHSGKLNFRAEYEGVSWIVAISLQSDELSLPRTDKDLESDPEGYDIQVSFRIDTKLGAVKDVSKINNRGDVTKSVDVRPNP
jgi:hypothetical protein